MNNQQPPMDESTFQQLQHELRELYRQQAIEQPPEDIDKAILALAKQHHVCDTTSPTSSGWKQHQLAIASAASIAVVAGLFYFYPTLLQQLPPNEPVAQLTQASSNVVNQWSKPRAMTSQVEVVEANSVLSQSPSVSAMSVQHNSDNPAINATQSKLQPAEVNVAKSVSANDVSNESVQITTASSRAGRSRLAVSTDIVNAAPNDIELDTADKAIKKLAQYVEQKQLTQARQMVTNIEQRFPELNNKKHPLYESFSKLKQQLTAQ